MNTKTYKPYPTATRFHNDYLKYKFRYIAGPPGSGKSVASVWELLAIGMRQEPTPKGIRPTKFAVIRDTYPNLQRATLPTLLHWLPEKYTTVKYGSPIVVRCVMPLPDGTKADMQFDLMAIATEADLENLKSYEATAVWINEMTGVPSGTIGKADERSGRYPPHTLWGDYDEQGNPINHITYRGVIGDYNYPSKDHWLVNFLHEGELPEDTMLYEQPPALIDHVDETTGQVTYEINPLAENLTLMDDGEKYINMLHNYLATGDLDQIQTQLLCRYGRAGGDGKKVITNFAQAEHVAPEKLGVMHHTNVMVSVDTSGIHPCALFWQYVRGAWQITDGIYGEEMGLEEFIDDVITPLLTLRYPDCDVLFVCDPANARDGRSATSPTALFAEKGYKAVLAPTNVFKDRVRAAEKLLARREKGRVLISPHITILIDALDGGYQFKKLRVTGITEQFSSNPLKNTYSHWADAFQYGALHIVNDTVSEVDVQMARKLARASIKRGRR